MIRAQLSRALWAGGALAALILTATPSLAQVYQLPFFADDLDRDERFFTRVHAQTTTQKHGFDISVYRRDGDGAWSPYLVTSTRHWADPQNENYRIYGKPFYAMRDGVVMGCWRNGPDNPRPKLPTEDSDAIPFEDRQWLHPRFREGLLPGGGNQLWIKHEDGSYALYAHAKPGSIPESTCPNSKTFFDAPVPDSATLLDGVVSPPVQVPARRRARVRAGQFLGLMGNSGNSTNPHIHIHVQRLNRRSEWEGTPIRFERGLVTRWNDGKAGLDGWERFNGQTIPADEVLFWPPIRLVGEYARHRLPADDLQLEFSHLAMSGFLPEILECYSVAGNVFFNMIWRPATVEWRAHFGMTGASIEERFNAAKEDGLHPVYLESCSSRNGPRYVAIFQRVPGLYRWRYGITTETHDDVLKQALADGLRPVTISVISTGGRRFYTELYRKVDYGSYQVRSQLDEAEYQKAMEANHTARRKLIYVDAYLHDGRPHFSAIFAQKPAGNWSARHGLTFDAYQTEWSRATRGGARTHALTGYDGARSDHRFAAAWWK